jgi:alginate biosynthesis protein AlgK
MTDVISRSSLLVLSGLAISIALAGCAGLPDEQLAKQAYESGDIATAEQNFSQLAALGYTDASIGLANIQAASGDPEQLRKAEQLYRQAAQTSPIAQYRLGRLLASKPDATVAEQHEAEGLLNKAFANGQVDALMPLAMLYLQHPQTFPNVDAQQRIDQWRQQGYPQAGLAQIALYRIQNTYPQHLDDVERICKGKEALMDVCYVELATVYQMRKQTDQRDQLVKQLRGAYGMGAVGPERVEAVAKVLSNPDIGPTDEKTSQEMLEQIAPNYPAAWVTLAQLLYEFPALGDADKMFDYLKRGQDANQSRAELLLGRIYYEGKLVPQDPQKAEQHLLKAAPTEPSAHYYLGQIYRRGYLGYIEPQKAVDHLLISARQGQPSADIALSQLYSQNRGIKVNLVNAYVFGTLAQQEGHPQAADLLNALVPQLNEQQKAQAQQLIKREQDARGAAWQAAVEAQAVAGTEGTSTNGPKGQQDTL